MTAAPSGSFLVFHAGDVEYHTLAVNVDGDIVTAPILFRDGLVGFTEPLSFESFQDALSAYNESQTDTHNTLRTPLLKPDISQLRGRQSQKRPVELLKSLRIRHSLLTQREDELDATVTIIDKLNKNIEDEGRELAAFGVLERILVGQVAKTRRLSDSSTTNIDLIDNNIRRIEERLTTLAADKQRLERSRKSLEIERAQHVTMYSDTFDGIRKLEAEINKFKEDLIEFSLYENCVSTMKLFIERLMSPAADAAPEPPAVYEGLCSKAANHALRGCPEGTFLVRRKSDPAAPYVLSISYIDEDQEEHVGHFPVLRIEGCIGFDEHTCIFNDIQDLVTCYTRIPFGSHDQTYGHLALCKQVSEKNIDEGRQHGKSFLTRLSESIRRK
ncbi:phosphatidylinositol 3-kinase regulatory subunit alpha-like isoform X2 [Mya arenaria]|nr:phosphatidylinositol 3-kinase regulatory subunit alpha-like isoform X2 [Mya arenaria]